MDSIPIKLKKAKLLQMNLRSIRQIGGWSAVDFGEKIGVKKQTISDLENNSREISLTQYLAIRAILDEEIASGNENATVLQKIIEICIDKGVEIEEGGIKELTDTVEIVAASALKGKKGGTLDKLLNILFETMTSAILLKTLVDLGVAIRDYKKY